MWDHWAPCGSLWAFIRTCRTGQRECTPLQFLNYRYGRRVPRLLMRYKRVWKYSSDASPIFFTRITLCNALPRTLQCAKVKTTLLCTTSLKKQRRRVWGLQIRECCKIHWSTLGVSGEDRCVNLLGLKWHPETSDPSPHLAWNKINSSQVAGRPKLVHHHQTFLAVPDKYYWSATRTSSWNAHGISGRFSWAEDIELQITRVFQREREN